MWGNMNWCMEGCFVFIMFGFLLVWVFWCFVVGFFFLMADAFVSEGLFLAKIEIIVMPWQPELGGKLEQSGLTKIYLKHPN